MTETQALNNCFSDLQRAAMAHLTNPNGKNAGVFLSHAVGILGGLQDDKKDRYFDELVSLQKRVGKSYGKQEDLNMADKILTIGLILKRPI